MKRGELVTVALPGDYGKPRPALILQSEHFVALPSVTVLPLTSELHSEHLLRVRVEPTRQNGLCQKSQIMVDKISTVSRARVDQRLGQLEAATMRAVEHSLARFLALA